MAGSHFVAAGFVALLASAHLAACGGVSEGEPSDDAGAHDERVPDAAAPDAGEPSGDDDAGSSEEGGVDAADAEPAPTRYCASLSPTPRFCDDFDDGSLSNGWAFTNVVPPGTIALDTAKASSAPAAMRVSVPALGAMSSGPAHVRNTILATAPHPRLSFSAFFTNAEVTTGALAIATLDVSLSHFFTLYLRDAAETAETATVVLEEINGGTTVRHLLTKPPPSGAWTRVTLDVDLAAGHASVTYDGETVLDAAPIATSGGTEVTFRVGGVFVFGPAAPFEAWFDDVVVDY